ncbi:major capsid protein [Paucibacter sp. TC2R-5]|uniref:major capsid protein n=1 Tax=Paucibacter sp. TC2R-5 TaxID=2893555 RepID=UPI0021E375D1|nr:major capsid protein [Paucibacter sp. TC2R-5]MCV2359636.1 major capsid protein [Paucibacter sp. TC2R-5]
MPTSNAGARIVDPILTNIAQGYSSMEFVGNNLFPEVYVGAAGGQIVEFDRDAFRLYTTRRSPGGSTREILFGYSGKPFALANHRLQGVIPREHQRDASAVAGIALDQVGIEGTMRAIRLALEVEQANLAFTPGNYGAANKSAVLAGAAKWSAATGTPLTDVDAGREAVRAACGLYPNVLVMSAPVFNACKNNPNVVNRFQYNGQNGMDATQITPAMLAGLFNVGKVVVGAAVYWNDVGVAQDIWGNYAVLAYVPQNGQGLRSRYDPSFGYTYVMQGHPMAEEPFWDNDKASWKYPVEMERAAVLSGIAAGYIIQTPN